MARVTIDTPACYV